MAESARWLDRWKLADLLLKLPLVEARFVRSDTASRANDPSPAAQALIALRAVNNLFVSARKDERGQLVACASAIDEWETFGLIRLQDNKVALRSVATGRYVTAEIDGTTELVANRPAILGWEAFGLLPHPAGEVAFRAFNHHFVGARLDSRAELTANAPAAREWEMFKVQLLS